MTIELDVDEATLDRLEELDGKVQEDVYMQVAFAVEDLVQNKHQKLRAAEKQQGQQVAPESVEQ